MLARTLTSVKVRNYPLIGWEIEKMMRDCLKTVVVGNSKSLRWKGLRASVDKPKSNGWSPPQRNPTQLRPTPFTYPSLQLPHPPYPRFPITSSSLPCHYQSLRFYLAGPQRLAAGLRKSLHPAPPAGGWLPLSSTRGVRGVGGWVTATE